MLRRPKVAAVATVVVEIDAPGEVAVANEEREVVVDRRVEEEPFAIVMAAVSDFDFEEFVVLASAGLQHSDY